MIFSFDIIKRNAKVNSNNKRVHKMKYVEYNGKTYKCYFDDHEGSPVKKGRNNNFFIKFGFPGYNSKTNNFFGYKTEKSALAAIIRSSAN